MKSIKSGNNNFLMGKCFYRHFTSEDTQMANEHTIRLQKYLFLGKCKLKPQLDIVMYILEWLLSCYKKKKTLTVPNVDKYPKQVELLYTVDGNAKWHSNCKKKPF
jgi:hypothetical protein